MNATALPKRSFYFRSFLFFTALTLGTGLLGWLIGGLSGFNALHPPPLMPPTNVLPILWVILYFMMGAAAYIVWNANDIDGGRVLRLYLIQLLVQMLWPLFFLRFEWRLLAFFWILLLIALASLVLTGFRYISKPAYWLTVPYLVCLLFTAYLNLGFYLLNR